VKKLISLGIMAAFLAGVSVPSIGCSKKSESKKITEGGGKKVEESTKKVEKDK
jgi:hypothetical protein